ncbi:hypothetical protein [Sulfobacillus thermosulfidooxidans]|uniref:hypothetical protein n=1 Tax=Sulfobacillus thermosulfidooxidans TaxID=28034 RepID=UPI0006B43377|nr:hypothetical protein [Sulfobacillus thermosulfidooxidans]
MKAAWYLTIPAASHDDSEVVCVTCSDAAETMEIERLESLYEAVALSERGPVRIDVSLIETPSAGQKVLVHGGVALGIVTEND